MKQSYLETIRLIERLHRRFLDVIKTELDRLGIEDINNVQTLILSNISNEQLTVGELTARGYYLGSNVSYNVKKLVENGYLNQERSPHDRRMTRVRRASAAVSGAIPRISADAARGERIAQPLFLSLYPIETTILYESDVEVAAWSECRSPPAARHSGTVTSFV